MLEGKFEKLEFQEMLSSPRRKNKNEQEQNKNIEKRNQEKWRIKEKNNEKKKMNERTTKNDPSCNDKNDPWSDHPEIQFGLIYPFFRNHEPWPTLHT